MSRSSSASDSAVVAVVPVFAVPVVRLVPQLMQNFAFAGDVAEQAEQVSVSSDPHWAQNFASG